MTYAISFFEIDGDPGSERVIEGETLESLSKQLHECGYEGSSLRVRDEQGSTRGWVSAKDWRAA